LRRSLSLVAILALHMFAIYGLARGFSNPNTHYTPAALQVEIFERDHRPEAPPVLRASRLPGQQPVQIVAPAIEFDLRADTPPAPIQLATIENAAAAPVSAPPPRLASLGPTTRPRPIYVPQGRERYPADSIRAKEFGEPTISICISETGAIDSVAVSRSSGFVRLDQAAIGIGRESKFKPAMRAGEPVPLCVNYRIKFEIENL